MGRLASTFRKDVIIQSRNNMYSVSLILAVLFAIIFSFIISPKYLNYVIPAALLLIVGGTTIVFIAALIMEEKELGILNALSVTPLKKGEFLISKILSLGFLASVEIAIMIGIPIAYGHYSAGIALPNIALLIAGIVCLNLMYTLLGIIIVVRFRKLTDFFLLAVFIMIFLQLPFVYYMNLITARILLVVPSAAPVMMIYGAYNRLENWQWAYTLIYTCIIILGLGFWVMKAYDHHVVRKLG